MRITKNFKIKCIRPNYQKLQIWSDQDIQRLCTSYFFSRDTMRFFRSKILSEVFCGPKKAYFVTSEKFNEEYPRLFTVRAFDPDDPKDMETVDEFQQYETRAQALSAALDHAFDESAETFYEKYAEDNQMSADEAQTLLDHGRKINHARTTTGQM